MTNILVTGNKGYIGSVLTQELISKGYQVVGFDTGYYDGCELYLVGRARQTDHQRYQRCHYG